MVALAAVAAGRGAVVASKREAKACGRLLVDTARVLNVTVAQLGSCLGVSVATIVHWTLRGVPRSQRDHVRQLRHRAVALTRRMPAARALRLLELQRRAADSLADGMRQISEAEGGPQTAAASTPRLIRGVMITPR